MSVRKKIDAWLQQFEKDFYTHNLIEISKSALLHNLNLFAELTGQTVIPVLKGNAYGHGVVQVALALTNQDLPYIAVDGYFEALRIREVSKQPALILGAIRPKNFANLHYDNYAFAVQDSTTIEALGKTGRHIKVHLECNTGMNRYGAQPSELKVLTQQILDYKNLQLEGIMSHLADSTASNPTNIDKAVERFDECVEIVRKAGGAPSLIHIAQSAGARRAHSKYANAIRLGIGLYGLNPYGPEHSLYPKFATDLHPALTLKSTITKINVLDPGDQVGYGYSYTAVKPSRIGVLPLGYFEGLNREAFSNAGIIKINEQFAPIVGRICMNHTMVSLDNLEVAVSQSVIVYSSNPHDQNSIDRLAQSFHLFNYSMVTALSSDIRRILID